MSEAVAVIDLEFRFISVNPSFSRITGYSEEEVVGQDSSLLNSGQHSADFHRRVRDILERTGHWAGEMWQRRKDGEEFLGWIELSEVRDSLGGAATSSPWSTTSPTASGPSRNCATWPTTTP